MVLSRTFRNRARRPKHLVIRSQTRPNPALEGALERTTALCRGLARGIPNTALLLLDRDLRVRDASGPRWARGGARTDDLTGRTLPLQLSLTDARLAHFANSALIVEDMRTDARWTAKAMRAAGVVSSASVLAIEDEEHAL